MSLHKNHRYQDQHQNASKGLSKLIIYYHPSNMPLSRGLKIDELFRGLQLRGPPSERGGEELRTLGGTEVDKNSHVCLLGITPIWSSFQDPSNYPLLLAPWN
ncbi:hypothetical protein CEXT_461481 [Caerostris extrusa]|uniref:CCZ1/INTU/HSP4 first Longin domain-containing protein n=1 Tax=Caerostris extrusa TaxID=172846 RepID=A0AAV4MZ41_CAEEX|nr:hypothetical protein CEXT_461481 [Caerostris extrusa]